MDRRKEVSYRRQVEAIVGIREYREAHRKSSNRTAFLKEKKKTRSLVRAIKAVTLYDMVVSGSRSAKLQILAFVSPLPVASKLLVVLKSIEMTEFL